MTLNLHDQFTKQIMDPDSSMTEPEAEPSPPAPVMPPAPAPLVYQCIANVSADIARQGISKSRTNTQQGYRFRGIDDVYNALAPILAKHGLVIIPRILTRTMTERQTTKGGLLFNVVVEAEFDFVAAFDASTHIARTFGEAMDSGDKATNKAMSAAYKYAMMQTFCIPTEGDNDADTTTHPPIVADISHFEPVPPPEKYEEWLVTFEAEANKGITKLRKAYAATKAAPFREYLTKYDKDRLDRLQKHANTIPEPDPAEAKP